jgi:hypothetical protein
LIVCVQLSSTCLVVVAFGALLAGAPRLLVVLLWADPLSMFFPALSGTSELSMFFPDFSVN